MTLVDGKPGREKQTVVLVDDDAMILMAMTDVLSGAGYEVHTARDGLEGLALIRAVKPDFIVLDVVLPKLDGGRLCAALRQDARFRQTPIISLSGLSPQDQTSFAGLTADACVAKGRLPVTAQNLLTAIRGFARPRPEEEKGQVLGYEDFQSRRMVTELLRERQHLVAILQALAPGALEVERGGRIAWVNAGACKILAMKEADLVGEAFVALTSPGDQPELRRLLSDLVQSGESAQVVTALNLDARLVSMWLVPIVEDEECSGVLIKLEGEVGESAEEG
jgi:DNA-binding response OmpR family regulator